MVEVTQNRGYQHLVNDFVFDELAKGRDRLMQAVRTFAHNYQAGTEQRIADALIAAGWTPPSGEKVATAHTINADHTVAVATDYYWNEDMSACPRGVKLQLLGKGGVAVYMEYRGDPFWVGWAPLPKRRPSTARTTA